MPQLCSSHQRHSLLSFPRVVCIFAGESGQNRAYPSHAFHFGPPPSIAVRRKHSSCYWGRYTRTGAAHLPFWVGFEPGIVLVLFARFTRPAPVERSRASTPCLNCSRLASLRGVHVFLLCLASFGQPLEAPTLLSSHLRVRLPHWLGVFCQALHSSPEVGSGP
jgi:hypothetical protein